MNADTDGLQTGDAHEKCMKAGHHICAEPSGRVCDTRGCDEAAGTWWGPYWCPRHDKERLDRITKSLESMARQLSGGA